MSDARKLWEKKLTELRAARRDAEALVKSVRNWPTATPEALKKAKDRQKAARQNLEAHRRREPKS